MILFDRSEVQTILLHVYLVFKLHLNIIFSNGYLALFCSPEKDLQQSLFLYCGVNTLEQLLSAAEFPYEVVLADSTTK
jgi:hypothetical protein